MSAAGKESHPNIDDILTSIRELIADDTAADDAASEPALTQDSNGISGDAESKDVISVLRGGGETAPQQTTSGTDTDAAPDDGVLDLSEDFIVTDDPEQAGSGDPQTSPAEEQPEDTWHNGVSESDPEGMAEAEPDPDPVTAETEPAGVDQTNIWEQDFQMPVDETGPRSPFTALRTNPESAWPANDPFDVTESYKLARSQVTNGRFIAPYGEEGTDPRDQQGEETAAVDPEAEQPEAQEVIELASLAGDAESDLEAGQDEAENEPDGDDTSQSEAASEQDDRGRPRNVVDEIEAVFGGPGAWASMVQQAVSEPGTEGETGEPVYQTDEHASVPGGEGGQTTDEPRDIPATEAVSDGTHLTHSPQYDHEQTAAPPYAGEPEHQGAVQPSKDPLHGDSALPSGASKSLEESVKELLRPMLQEWLDKNMPRLVEAAMREQAAAQAQRSEHTADESDTSGDWPDRER